MIVPVTVVNTVKLPAASSIKLIEKFSPTIPVIVPLIVTDPPLY